LQLIKGSRRRSSPVKDTAITFRSTPYLLRWLAD
jgi:hypothetical protein